MQGEPTKLHKQAGQGLQGMLPRHPCAQIQVKPQTEPENLEGRPQPGMYLGRQQLNGDAEHALHESLREPV